MILQGGGEVNQKALAELRASLRSRDDQLEARIVQRLGRNFYPRAK